MSQIIKENNFKKEVKEEEKEEDKKQEDKKQEEDSSRRLVFSERYALKPGEDVQQKLREI